MFGTHDLPLFVVTALVVNATPGADFLYTVTRTLRHGWRGGVRRFGANATVRRALNLIGATLFASLAVRLAVSER
jgi:threonine/homoserine/homoserine lactone efflux protein